MHRLLVIVTLAIAWLAMTASPGSSLDPSRDHVTGRAQHLGADPPFPVIEVRIRASSNPDGTEPRGRLVVTNQPPLASYRGDISCLRVRGRQATIGIEIVRSTDPSLIGLGELWNVIDARPSGPDGVAGFPFTSTPPSSCPPPTFTVPVISGDYTVLKASR